VTASVATSAAPAAHPPKRRKERRSLKRRFFTWLEHRIPLSDSWTLTQRNIYIVPTKAGWGFAVMLLLMLLGAINYQLNLGYLLTFLLAGCALVSMHLTHGTLKGLTLRMRPTPQVHVGEAAVLEVVLTSPGSARHGIGLAFQDTFRFGQRQAFTDVPAHGQATARLSMEPRKRGHQPVPTIRAETRFPLGLFRAWTVWRPAATVLAYPKPETPAPPMPSSRSASGDVARHRRGDGGEFDGVRPWRRGDTMRQVVWKKVARTGELVSREASQTVSRELWLDWQDARGASGNPEERLSRLCAWVLAADRAGHPFGLRLPGRDIAPGQGDVHRRQMLEVLALWP
jgi:uncharacterized protein (DUF58 family)